MKTKSNEELLIELVNLGEYGILQQIIIMVGLENYLDRVISGDENGYENFGGFINTETYRDCCIYLKERILNERSERFKAS